MKKLPLSLIALIQTLGLAAYITTIGLFIWNAEHLIGKMNNFFGPVLFLTIFVLSAIICALITLSYPVILFWDQKKTKEAIKLVIYTASWLGAITLTIIFSLILLK